MPVSELDTIKAKDRHGYNTYARLHPERWSTEPEGLLAQLERTKADAVFQRCVNSLHMTQDMKLLEIGGGVCEPSFAFAEKGLFCVGSDHNLDDVCGLGAARTLGTSRNGHSPLLIVTDYESLPFAAGAFDIIYAKATLHHATNLDKALKEAARVLKIGGQFALEEPGRGLLIPSNLAYRNYYHMPHMTHEQNENAPTLLKWWTSLKSSDLHIKWLDQGDRIYYDKLVKTLSR